MSPARLRECLSRWTAGGDGAARSRTRRRPKCAPSNTQPTITAGHVRTEQRHSDRPTGDDAVNASTWNLRRSFAGRMLADPARRSLISRPARRVCCAVKAYRITRRCPWLRGARHRQPEIDAQLPVTLFTRSPWSTDTPCPRSIRSQTPIIALAVYGDVAGQSSTHLVYLLHNQATSLCYSWSNDCALSVTTCVTCRFDCTARCAPSRYSALRCGPPLTALAPPPALLVWLHAGVIIVKRFLRHEDCNAETGDRHADEQ